jgi:Fe2+ or Zn2+ uptake regulation protein
VSPVAGGEGAEPHRTAAVPTRPARRRFLNQRLGRSPRNPSSFLRLFHLTVTFVAGFTAAFQLLGARGLTPRGPAADKAGTTPVTSVGGLGTVAMGCPAKGYKLTPSRIDVLRALAIHGPFTDRKGRAVSQLLPFTTQSRPQSLSCALEGLEAVGLVRRETHSQRTYRIEAVLDRLTPTDLATLNLPEPLPAIVLAPQKKAGLYLTRPRVEVLRALLADGPIDDPTGHATRLLMGRLGRSDFGGTHALITGMARVGLIRRTVRQGRVVGLAATIDHLPDNDRYRIWSTVEFPVEAIAPVEKLASSSHDDLATLRAELEAARAQIEAQQAELQAEKVGTARLRIQYEMFRAWAKRMPGIDDPALSPNAPAADNAIDPAAPVFDRNEAESRGDDRTDDGVEAVCQYVYPDYDPDRCGQACSRQRWEGSAEWCWAHDPTPVIRRKAFTVRRVGTTS